MERLKDGREGRRADDHADRRGDGNRDEQVASSDPRQPFARHGGWTVFASGLASGLLWWLSLPPVGWSVLGIVAPLPLLGLVTVPELPGRRPYGVLWLAASLWWLVYLQGVRLAHPALYAGWFALSLYVAVYTPAFVALTRLAVTRHRWPLPLAAPVVWVALELVRGHLLGGFTGGMLGHSQIDLLWILQLADLGGAYLLSAWVMLVAACLWQAGPWRTGRGAASRWRHLAMGVVAIAAACGYGAWRLGASPVSDTSTRGLAPPRIVLIQESIDTVFEYNPRRNIEAFERYLDRTLAACVENAPVDAAVWPESMFTENTPELLWTDRAVVDPPEELRTRQAAFTRKSAYVLGRINALSPETVLIAGSTTVELNTVGFRDFNSAILLGPKGDVVDRYHKQHLVMFGEYIPLGGWFPWLYQLAGMPGELAAGTEHTAFAVKQWRLAPSVCFESLVPHLMRRKIDVLESRGQPVDAQVNITNDGWFWGSALLDMHLQAGVLRAVELRRPFLVAANTGLSAWVDSDGRVRAAGPRRAGASLLASPRPDRRFAPYRLLGDIPWWLCLAATLYVAGKAAAVSLVRPMRFVPRRREKGTASR